MKYEVYYKLEGWMPVEVEDEDAGDNDFIEQEAFDALMDDPRGWLRFTELGEIRQVDTFDHDDYM